jgi:gluconokinase
MSPPSGDEQQPVLVIMGVSGSGKSTVAGLLAARLGWDLQEGDDLHPTANIAKMAAGTPLTDEDRWPWLDRVAEWISARVAAGRPGIITCSALKREYRDRLRGDHVVGDHVVFVHLAGSRDTISRRLSARRDHFMPGGLLDSQRSALQPPDPDEKVITADVSGPAAAVVSEIIGRLRIVPE